MKYCSNCGKENPEGTLYCNGCGTAIAGNTANQGGYPVNQGGYMAGSGGFPFQGGSQRSVKHMPYTYLSYSLLSVAKVILWVIGFLSGIGCILLGMGYGFAVCCGEEAMIFALIAVIPALVTVFLYIMGAELIGLFVTMGRNVNDLSENVRLLAERDKN
jgi:hypothetical protein